MSNTGEQMDKTHFRKAFNSPYLGSADIVGETILTVDHVTLEKDKTKKTSDQFNTAYFAEKELRPGEKLKPMILNATNSKAMHKMTGSPYIDDWENVKICVWVDKNVKMMGSTVEGLRIKPAPAKRIITPETKKWWAQAVEAYRRDQNFDEILKHADISEENQALIMEAAHEAPQD
jgi:hypothetical protein